MNYNIHTKEKMKKNLLLFIIFVLIITFSSSIKANAIPKNLQGLGESINLYTDSLIYPTTNYLNRKSIFTPEAKQSYQSCAECLNLYITEEAEKMSSSFEDIIQFEKSFIDINLGVGYTDVKYNATTEIKSEFKTKNTLNFKDSIASLFYKFFYKRSEYRCAFDVNPTNISQLNSGFLAAARRAKNLHNASSLFLEYGTHIIKAGDYGGLLNINYSSVSKSRLFEESSNIKSSNDITQRIFNVQTSASQETINEAFYGANTREFESQLHATSYGGNGNGLPNSFTQNYGEMFQSWENSIENKPVIISFPNSSFYPVWEFLPNDEFYEFKIEARNQFAENYYKRIGTKIELDLDNSNCDPKLYLESKTYLRNETYEIDDKKNNVQRHDEIKISNHKKYNIEKMILLGYKRLNLTLKITMCEKNDGYARLYLTDSYTDDYDVKNSFLFVENDLNKTDRVYEYKTSIELNKISNNNLFILYRADGSLADNWYNKNLSVKFEFLK